VVNSWSFQNMSKNGKKSLSKRVSSHALITQCATASTGQYITLHTKHTRKNADDEKLQFYRAVIAL
jgi:hypothetical protein